MILKIKNENGVWIDIPSIQGAPGPAGKDGEPGPAGPAGKTPVKGVDYFTEEEKQEFLNECSKTYCFNTYVNKPISAEEKVMLEDIYNKVIKKNINFSIWFGSSPVVAIDTGYSDDKLDLYIARTSGGYYYHRFNFNATTKKLTSTTFTGTKAVNESADNVDVYASDSLTGKSSTVGDQFNYVKTNYALKSEIPSTDGLATEEYVNNAISNIPSSGGGGEKSTFFIDFSNATTANQDCPQEMIEFAEYMANNDAASLYITDGLNNETGYYYPAMWQATSTKKQFSILKATFNLNRINSKTYFRIYQLKYSGDKWVYNYLLKDYDFQLITESNISNFLSDYITTSQLDEAIGGITTPEPDLTDYYTKTEVDNLIPDVGGFQTQTQVQSLINASLAAIGVAEEGAY